jgi:hypothetical protein
MRTFLLMFMAVGLAAAAFAIYLHNQGPLQKPPPDQVASGNLGFDPDAETAGDVGPGQKPWIRVLDSLRRLQYRFRADDYTPRGGGLIDVSGVEAHFFQYVDESKDPNVRKFRTQQVRIHGKNGNIEVQQAPQASPGGGGFEKGPGGPPKRGLLNDVTIYVISRWTPELERRLREPGAEQALANITATMPNIAFDNERFEITTHEYTDVDGTFVPADQVPVHATGDYEFNGKGMTLRWNDVDGRLEYLEVAHGNYLVVRDADMLHKSTPGGFGPVDKGPPTRPIVQGASTDGMATPLLDERGRPLQFAAAGKPKPATGPGSKGGSRKKQKGPQPPYRATFDDNVTISEGEPEVSESQLAQADAMKVEFLPGTKAPATRPSSQPATKPGVAANEPPATQAAAAPTTQSAAAPATRPQLAAGAPQTRPTSRPSGDAPLIIRWTGKLRVVPIDEPGDIPPALKPGESVVRLLGTKSPVQLSRETMRAWCAGADYFSSDGSAQLTSSKQYGPVRLKQIADPNARGGMQEADITTQQINYNGTNRVAVLHGESTAHIIMPQQPATRPAVAGTTAIALKPATQPAPQALDATWTKEGRLHFQPAVTGAAMSFERAELEGDVDVKHPQMALRSQRLDLFFEDRPATRPTTAPATNPASQPSTRPVSQSILKRMIATTRVWCDLTDSSGRRQTVTTDRLTMATALDTEGKLYPQIINADGKAHAYDGQQDLQAGHLQLKLVPATRPATRPTTRSTAATAPASTGDLDTASVELQEMKAWSRVFVRNAEGSTAVGERMDVHVIDGQPIARLEGSPLAAWTTYGWLGRRLESMSRVCMAPLASVTDPKGSRATGPIIDFDPRRQWAKVTGRGTIRAIQSDPRDAKSATQPTTRSTASRPSTQPAPKFADIFWEQNAELDGAKNLITVSGPVLIASTDADGTRQTATGKRAVIELIDRPATQPTTKPVAKTEQTKPAAGTAAKPGTRPTTRAARSTTRPSGGAAGIAGGGMDVLKDKIVSAFNLEKDAVVNSTLADATGILRQTEIRSNTLRYETGETAATAGTRPAASPLAIGSGGTGRLLALGPGTMISRDHRPPATRPAKGQTPADPPPPDQARGATAFRWEKGMTYDQPTRKSTMLGNVLIVHQADEPQAEPVRVNGERVEAFFEPKPQPATQPTTRPGVRPATRPANESPESAMQLKWLTIKGNVVMDRGGSTLTADRADYNPATGWLVAVGAPRVPAVYSNSTGADITYADEIHWNTQTWIAKFIGIRGRASAGDKTALPGGK